MDGAESPSADRGHNLVAKRTASEELNTVPDAKKVKGFHDGSIEPDVKSPRIIRMVPFPEKVR
jgi:histone acetyltransferase